MRILLIHNYYQYYGGEETYFESLVKLLKSKGNKVTTYTKNSNNIGKGLLPKMRVAFGFFWNCEVEKELSQLIKDFKPEVAHFNNIYPLITSTAYRVCRKFNIPIVQTIHNYRFVCPKGILFRNGKICELCVKKYFPFPSNFFSCYHHSFFSSLVFSLAFSFHKLIGSFNFINKYIFPSEFTKDYYLSNLNIPEKKVAVIPYFVDMKKEQFKIVKRKDYYLFVGRLSEEKGIIELLNIFKYLPDKKLMVVGTGPLKNKVNEYKKYKNIKIMGFIPRVKIAYIIANAKKIIIPSLWYEVLPFIYIEGLKQKTPVVLLYNNYINNKSNKFVQSIPNFKKRIFMNKVRSAPSSILRQFSKRYHYEQLIQTYGKI